MVSMPLCVLLQEREHELLMARSDFEFQRTQLQQQAATSKVCDGPVSCVLASWPAYHAQRWLLSRPLG